MVAKKGTTVVDDRKNRNRETPERTIRRIFKNTPQKTFPKKRVVFDENFEVFDEFPNTHGFFVVERDFKAWKKVSITKRGRERVISLTIPKRAVVYVPVETDLEVGDKLAKVFRL